MLEGDDHFSNVCLFCVFRHKQINKRGHMQNHPCKTLTPIEHNLKPISKRQAILKKETILKQIDLPTTGPQWPPEAVTGTIRSPCVKAVA